MMDNKKNKALVIAVHPDDETLGCAGTLLRHKFNRDKIYWLIVTDLKEAYGYAPKAVRIRTKEIKRVSRKYNFDGVINLQLPPNKLNEFSLHELIIKFSKIIQTIKPTIIYLPFKNDVHSDHRIIFKAMYPCTKSFNFPFFKKIYMMEIPSETEFSPAIPGEVFIPNIFVDISKFMRKKLEIMKIYKSEIGQHPFPRSMENMRALAIVRGATAGCRYAESFMLLKEIV